MNKSNRTYKLLATAISLCAFLLAGHALAQNGKIFSHKLHIEEGASCEDCHDKTADKPAIIKDSCSGCHDEPMTGAKPKKLTGKLPMSFPHVKHAESLECLDCHKATAEDSAKPGKPVQGYDDCQKCHKENDVKTAAKNCAICHGADARKIAPADHAVAWERRHGQESSWRVFNDHGRDCKLCHQDNACQSCHRTTKPKNHGGLWRMRTHGKAASWDKNSCKTCHETGTCIRCHKETKPTNHAGNWRYIHKMAGKASGDSCKVCHCTCEPSCVECHNR